MISAKWILTTEANITEPDTQEILQYASAFSIRIDLILRWDNSSQPVRDIPEIFLKERLIN